MWAIRASYNCTLYFTPGKAVFVRDMLFKLTSIIDWRVVTAKNQQQADIDNVCENSRQFRHYYAMGDIVYVEETYIYRKLDYKKQGPYITTEFFINVTVRF